MLVCFAFSFRHTLTFIRYTEVYFTFGPFGLLDCVRYNEDFVISRFVISRFCSIYFTVILAGLKKIVRYTFVKSRFYCITCSYANNLKHILIGLQIIKLAPTASIKYIIRHCTRLSSHATNSRKLNFSSMLRCNPISGFVL